MLPEPYQLLAVAMFCFWQAQNTINSARIALLGLSAAVVAFAAIRFIRSTRLYAAGVLLFAAVAVIIPVMCIGYNPYAVLSAKRSRVCTDYTASPSGLLYVWNPQTGSGIRDRYGVILPAEYDRIQIMVPYLPYFMVQKSGKWKKTGKYTTPRLDWVADAPERDTLTVFSRKGKRGFLNVNDGRIVIEAQYDKAWVFSEGLAAVVKDKKIGFVNARNEVVLPFRYD